MPHFGKNLEDASDEELKRWVNENSPPWISLASDELTRRCLGGLQGKVENLNKTTNKSNVMMIVLTIVMITLTGVLVWQGLK